MEKIVHFKSFHLYTLIYTISKNGLQDKFSAGTNKTTSTIRLFKYLSLIDSVLHRREMVWKFVSRTMINFVRTSCNASELVSD